SQPLLPGAAWPREWQEPCLGVPRGSSRQRRMTLPATRRTIPLVNMLASGRAGLSCMVVVERMVSTTPQTSSTRALSSSTRQSDKPPLFRSSIWSRLRMQFMSWIAELSSCFSSTSRASRQSVVPTASRHSPDRLLVLYSRMMPPIPQHRMDFLGSWNHHSSTCSSRMFLWMWSASAGVRGVLSSASSGMVGGWVGTERGGGRKEELDPHSKGGCQSSGGCEGSYMSQARTALSCSLEPGGAPFCGSVTCRTTVRVPGLSPPSKQGCRTWWSIPTAVQYQNVQGCVLPFL
uniref:Uncharacterized protein n=1 Tax=Cairina moschata TaxID=8855 RepID=A0A8C3B254_CAIMO